MDKVLSITQMEVNMRVNGKKILKMDMVSSLLKMELAIKDHLKMIE
jgi:hypothetical protein